MILDNIKLLVDSLPCKDIPISKKFIQDRDFESLKELVDSAIVKIKKAYKNDSNNLEYNTVNLQELNQLKSEIDLYCTYLEIPETSLNEVDTGEYDEEYYE